MAVEEVTLTGSSESLNEGWGKYNNTTKCLLVGDTTSKKFFRVVNVAIKNGTTANTIKPSAVSEYNGDAVTEEDNLGQSGDTGNFSLDATKAQLHIDAAALTGNAAAIISSEIYKNASGNLIYIEGDVVSNGITLKFTLNDGTAYDLTTAVDTGEIYIRVTYLTDA